MSSATEPVAGTAARRARREASRRGGTSPSPSSPAPPAAGRRLDPDALAALEEERDFLLRSLRDLEREHAAGDVDDVDHEALRDDYTARAAAVLRAIESRQAAMAARAARTPADRRRRLVTAVVVALLAVVSGLAVAQASGRRGAGDEITGDIRQSARDKVLDARRAMGEGRYRDAIGLFDEVVAMSPSNVEARAYKGWLLILTARELPAGDDRDLLRARALEALDEAIELDAGYGDARVFRAMARAEVGQPAAGLADLDALDPSDVPIEMRQMVSGLRERLQREAAAAG